jgi:hypothetical protein
MSTMKYWEAELTNRLPLLGHRNWIVVADSAYPAQSNPGIETIVTGADQLGVVRETAAQISASSHIRANIYIDTELSHVPENDAPGVSAYRSQLQAVFKGASIRVLPHEEIIRKLDTAGSLFRVLILKTRLTIPYTSVFFELDCGYWTAEAEARLRTAISAAVK